MRLVKLFVGLAEKIQFSPINLEQLSLFEQDSIVSESFLNFDYYNIKPQNVISAIKKSL